jgi:hypothetical protein
MDNSNKSINNIYYKKLINIICKSITIIHFNKHIKNYPEEFTQKIKYFDIVLSKFIDHPGIGKTVYPF